MTDRRNDMPVLPKGWIWTKLSEIGDVASGGTPSTKDKDAFDGEVPWLTPADLSNFNRKFVSRGRRNISEKGLRCSSAVMLPAGSILFSSRAPIGYVAIASNSISTNQGFKNLTPYEGIFSEYVFYYLKANKRLAESLASGTTFLEISASRFGLIPVPLPPLPEQHRIVAKVEELFTKLDAGVEALKKVKAQLKRYRHAVLKYAFEGRLTEEWRNAHKDKIEPAVVLLEWTKLGRSKTFDQKHREFPPANTLDLPGLPEEWVWTRLNAICDKIQDGSHFSPEIQYGTPGNERYLYVTAKNVREKGVDLSDVTYVDRSFHQSIFCRCNPEKGDVLLVKDGVKTGIAAINNLEEEFSLLSSVALLKANREILVSRYLKHFLNSPLGIKMTTGQMTGTAIKRIILDRIRLSHVPLAPLAEQNRIVDEIESRFSLADAAEQVIVKTLMQAEQLRQSILKRAFEGKLVSQDPNDEPAEQLLERIKAEKARFGERNVKKKRKMFDAGRLGQGGK